MAVARTTDTRGATTLRVKLSSGASPGANRVSQSMRFFSIPGYRAAVLGRGDQPAVGSTKVLLESQNVCRGGDVVWRPHRPPSL